MILPSGNFYFTTMRYDMCIYVLWLYQMQHCCISQEKARFAWNIAFFWMQKMVLSSKKPPIFTPKLGSLIFCSHVSLIFCSHAYPWLSVAKSSEKEEFRRNFTKGRWGVNPGFPTGPDLCPTKNTVVLRCAVGIFPVTNRSALGEIFFWRKKCLMSRAHELAECAMWPCFFDHFPYQEQMGVFAPAGFGFAGNFAKKIVQSLWDVPRRDVTHHLRFMAGLWAFSQCEWHHRRCRFLQVNGPFLSRNWLAIVFFDEKWTNWTHEDVFIAYFKHEIYLLFIGNLDFIFQPTRKKASSLGSWYFGHFMWLWGVFSLALWKHKNPKRNSNDPSLKRLEHIHFPWESRTILRYPEDVIRSLNTTLGKGLDS